MTEKQEPCISRTSGPELGSVWLMATGRDGVRVQACEVYIAAFGAVATGSRAGPSGAFQACMGLVGRHSL